MCCALLKNGSLLAQERESGNIWKREQGQPASTSSLSHSLTGDRMVMKTGLKKLEVVAIS